MPLVLLHLVEITLPDTNWEITLFNSSQQVPIVPPSVMTTRFSGAPEEKALTRDISLIADNNVPDVDERGRILDPGYSSFRDHLSHSPETWSSKSREQQERGENYPRYLQLSSSGYLWLKVQTQRVQVSRVQLVSDTISVLNISPDVGK